MNDIIVRFNWSGLLYRIGSLEIDAFPLGESLPRFRKQVGCLASADPDRTPGGKGGFITHFGTLPYQGVFGVI